MKNILVMLLSGLAGGLLVYGLLSAGLGDALALRVYPKWYTWVFLVTIPVSYLFVVGWHELGHVAFGKWQDFSFRGLTIGPFSWKTDGDEKVRFGWNRSLNLAGGVAFMMPNGEARLRQRFRWYAAGGPIFSLLLMVLGFALAKPLPYGSFPEYLAGGIGLLSLMIFLVTILPFRSGGFVSDGMRILTFSRDTPRARADLLHVRIMTFARSGKSYREIPIDEIEAVLGYDELDDSQLSITRYFGYVYHLAHGNYDRAEEELNKVMEKVATFPGGMRENFYLEAATFQAAFRNNLEAAEAMYADYKSTPLTQEIDARFYEAAVSRLRGDRAAFLAAVAEVRRLAPTAMDQSALELKLGRIEAWERAEVA